jgi:hypothetical protein
MAKVDFKLQNYKQSCYQTMPVEILTSKATKAAFKTRMRVGEFLYD